MALRPGGSGDVVGPASATDNAIVRFDATTGKLVQNSAATIADTSGDITCGAVNGVTVSFSSVVDGEMLFRSGTGLDGKDRRFVVKSGGQTTSSDSLVDVTDLAFASLKASTTYAYRFWLPYQTSATTTGMRNSVNFSGTVTSTHYAVFGSTSSTALVINNTTTNNAEVGATTAGPGTTDRLFVVEGVLVVGGSGGTLQLRFKRGTAAGSATIQANAYGSLWEV